MLVVVAMLGCAGVEEAMTSEAGLLAGELEGGFESETDRIWDGFDWLEVRVVVGRLTRSRCCGGVAAVVQEEEGSHCYHVRW